VTPFYHKSKAQRKEKAEEKFNYLKNDSDYIIMELKRFDKNFYEAYST
jgi:hypothetical protein